MSTRIKVSHSQFLQPMALCLMLCMSGILGITPNPGLSRVSILVCKKVQTQLKVFLLLGLRKAFSQAESQVFSKQWAHVQLSPHKYLIITETFTTVKTG